MNYKSNEIIINSMPMMGMTKMMDPSMGMIYYPINMGNDMDMMINPINMIIPTMNPLDSKNITLPDLSIKDWSLRNLIFENNRGRINIAISEQKLVEDAISIYRMKTGNKEKCKFILIGKDLFTGMKICHSGLCNNSYILVLSLSNVIGAIKIDIHDFPTR